MSNFAIMNLQILLVASCLCVYILNLMFVVGLGRPFVKQGIDWDVTELTVNEKSCRRNWYAKIVGESDAVVASITWPNLDDHQDLSVALCEETDPRRLRDGALVLCPLHLQGLEKNNLKNLGENFVMLDSFFLPHTKFEEKKRKVQGGVSQRS